MPSTGASFQKAVVNGSEGTSEGTSDDDDDDDDDDDTSSSSSDKGKRKKSAVKATSNGKSDKKVTTKANDMSNGSNSAKSTKTKAKDSNASANTNTKSKEKATKAKKGGGDEKKAKKEKHGDSDLDAERQAEEAALESGLTTAEAATRLERDGPNEIETKSISMWRLLLSKFTGALPFLIELAVVLALVNALISGGEAFIDFGVLLALLLINGFLGFYEERNANKAVAALQQQLAPSARVVRDGKWQTIAARELVAGDILSVKLGSVVPADCEVVSGELDVDESALTGESLPVSCQRGDKIKSAGVARKGEALCRVVATGTRTYLGEAIALMGGGEQQAAASSAQAAEAGAARRPQGSFRDDVGDQRRTPKDAMVGDSGPVTASTHVRWWQRFRRRRRSHPSAPTSHMHRVLLSIANVLITVALAAVVFLFFFLVFSQKESALTVVGLCLVLLVASIPVAIEVVSTAVLSVGASMLAKRDCVVTRLAAIEELAAVTTLCSDKTGTLTLNKLQLGESWVADDKRVDADRALMYAALTIKRGEPDAIDTCVLDRIDSDEKKAVLEDANRYDVLEFHP